LKNGKKFAIKNKKLITKFMLIEVLSSICVELMRMVETVLVIFFEFRMIVLGPVLPDTWNLPWIAPSKVEPSDPAKAVNLPKCTYCNK
jgi:hypothetical protein